MGGLQYYTIAGRQVGSHYLAVGVLGTLFGGIALANMGPKKVPAAPQIQASSSEEVDFIKKFLEENGEQKPSH